MMEISIHITLEVIPFIPLPISTDWTMNLTSMDLKHNHIQEITFTEDLSWMPMIKAWITYFLLLTLKVRYSTLCMTPIIKEFTLFHLIQTFQRYMFWTLMKQTLELLTTKSSLFLMTASLASMPSKSPPQTDSIFTTETPIIQSMELASLERFSKTKSLTTTWTPTWSMSTMTTAMTSIMTLLA